MNTGILSPTELATLRTEFAKPTYASLTDEQRFDLLHQPSMIANPVPQGQVPVPWYDSTIIGQLSPDSLAKISVLPSLPTVVDNINTMNATAVATWATFYAAVGSITADEKNAILATVSATQSDPSWQANVPLGPSIKQALFGAEVWTYPNGSTVNFVPLPDVVSARSS